MPTQSVLIRDSSFLTRVLQQYLSLLKKYPIITKSVTRSVYIIVKARWLAVDLGEIHFQYVMNVTTLIVIVLVVPQTNYYEWIYSNITPWSCNNTTSTLNSACSDIKRVEFIQFLLLCSKQYYIKANIPAVYCHFTNIIKAVFFLLISQRISCLFLSW